MIKDLRASYLNSQLMGVSIFPLTPGTKVPYKGSKGFVDAKPAKEWLEWPKDANVGIACGRVSGIVVIDCDSAAAEQSFYSILQRIGAAKPTTGVLTPRGKHFYFGIPNDHLYYPCSQSRLGLGIDVRGDGGYVVGPGSVVGNLEYSIFSSDALINAMPPRLAEFLQRLQCPHISPETPPPVEDDDYCDFTLNIRITRGADGRLRAEVVAGDG